MEKTLSQKYRSPFQWQFWVVRERINPDTGKVYTEEEAKSHVNSFKKPKFEYWLKRCSSVEEAEIEFAKFKEYSSKLIKEQHDINKGRTDRIPTQIGYWLKRGYSEEEAIELQKERQKTFTIEKCIEKYGEEEGREKYLERQIKWQETINNKEDQSFHRLKSFSLEMFFERGLTIDDYCKHRRDKDKSDEYLLKKTKAYILDNNLEQTTEIFNKYYYQFKRQLLKIRGVASRESLTYLIPLYKFCRRNGIERDDIMLGLSGSKEFVLDRNIKRKGRRGTHRFYRFDFTILSKKIIIEYNSLVFHPDPDMMGDEFDKFLLPKCKTPAREKYEMDKKKIKFAEEHGYTVYVIWGHEDFDEQMNKMKQLILA